MKKKLDKFDIHFASQFDGQFEIFEKLAQGVIKIAVKNSVGQYTIDMIFSVISNNLYFDSKREYETECNDEKKFIAQILKLLEDSGLQKNDKIKFLDFFCMSLLRTLLYAMSTQLPKEKLRKKENK